MKYTYIGTFSMKSYRFLWPLEKRWRFYFFGGKYTICNGKLKLKAQ